MRYCFFTMKSFSIMHFSNVELEVFSNIHSVEK